MFNLDPEKLLMIGILALVVLGPNRLPGAARSVGRVLAQLRHMSGSFQTEVRDALAEPRQALQHAVDEFGISEVRSSMTSVSDTFRPKSLVDGLFSAPAASQPGAPPASQPRTAAPGNPHAGQAPGAIAGDPLSVPDDPSFN